MGRPVFFDEVTEDYDKFDQILDIADKVDLEHLLAVMELEEDPVSAPELEGLFGF